MSNFLQELIEQEKQLTAECENHPRFKRLQAIRVLIQHEKSKLSASGKSSDGTKKTRRPRGQGKPKTPLLTTPEQRNFIANAIEEHLRNVNQPTTVKELVQVLQDKNIEVPGKNKGVTIGAILNGKKDKFTLGENRLWRLI